MVRQALEEQVAYLLKVLRCATLPYEERTIHLTRLYVLLLKLRAQPEPIIERRDDPSQLQLTQRENYEGNSQSSSANPSHLDQQSSGDLNLKGSD